MGVRVKVVGGRGCILTVYNASNRLYQGKQYIVKGQNTELQKTKQQN